MKILSFRDALRSLRMAIPQLCYQQLALRARGCPSRLRCCSLMGTRDAYELRLPGSNFGGSASSMATSRCGLWSFQRLRLVHIEAKGHAEAEKDLQHLGCEG